MHGAIDSSHLDSPELDLVKEDIKSRGRRADSDDYFYDDSLKPEEIEELQKKKKEEEKASKEIKSKKASTEAPPEWFNKKEENPMEGFVKSKCQEYIRKYFEEMTSSKSKSTLNHSVLSVITLTGFFSVGIFIGLIIVLIKGRKFKKINKKLDQYSSKLEPKTLAVAATENKNAKYTSVQQSEQVV